MSLHERFEIETVGVSYWEPHEGNCETTVYLAFHIDKDGKKTPVTTCDGQVSRFGNELDARAAIQEYLAVRNNLGSDAAEVAIIIRR